MMKPKAEFCDGGIVKLDMRQIVKIKDMAENTGGGVLQTLPFMHA